MILENIGASHGMVLVTLPTLVLTLMSNVSITFHFRKKPELGECEKLKFSSFLSYAIRSSTPLRSAAMFVSDITTDLGRAETSPNGWEVFFVSFVVLRGRGEREPLERFVPVVGSRAQLKLKCQHLVTLCQRFLG